MHWGYDWVQLIELETSLGCLLDEKMAILKVLEMVQSSVRPKGMCLGKQKEIPKETSLVPASAESMAIQKVLMTEIDWVELTEMDLAQLMGSQKVMSLVCPITGRLVTRMGQMTESCLLQLMEMLWVQDLMTETSSACLLAELMEMPKVTLMDVGLVQLMVLRS